MYCLVISDYNVRQDRILPDTYCYAAAIYMFFVVLTMKDSIFTWMTNK